MALASWTFVQKAELMALIRVLNSGKGKMGQYLYQFKICLPGIKCPSSYTEGEGIPLWEGIPNKTWKGNSPIIRGCPPTKESGSDLLQGHQKDLTLATQGNNQANQKAIQEALQPLYVLPGSILSLFPHRSLYILNILLMRKKGWTVLQT
jgi:hypothetical protein